MVCCVLACFVLLKVGYFSTHVNGYEYFYMSMGERLKNERIRMGLSQSDAADACGVTRAMWGRYERGKASMGADVLARFVAVGADAVYILTNQYAPPPRDLTPREAALLDNYRHSPEDARRNLETTSALLAQRGGVEEGAKGKKAG